MKTKKNLLMCPSKLLPHRKRVPIPKRPSMILISQRFCSADRLTKTKYFNRDIFNSKFQFGLPVHFKPDNVGCNFTCFYSDVHLTQFYAEKRSWEWSPRLPHRHAAIPDCAGKYLAASPTAPKRQRLLQKVCDISEAKTKTWRWF